MPEDRDARLRLTFMLLSRLQSDASSVVHSRGNVISDPSAVPSDNVLTGKIHIQLPVPETT